MINAFKNISHNIHSITENTASDQDTENRKYFFIFIPWDNISITNSEHCCHSVINSRYVTVKILELDKNLTFRLYPYQSNFIFLTKYR